MTIRQYCQAWRVSLDSGPVLDWLIRHMCSRGYTWSSPVTGEIIALDVECFIHSAGFMGRALQRAGFKVQTDISLFGEAGLGEFIAGAIPEGAIPEDVEVRRAIVVAMAGSVLAAEKA